MRFFFFNDTATTEIYTYVHTLSLHDALPICVLIEPNAVPQDDIKAPPRVLAQRTGLARLAYWLVQDRIAVHTARLFHQLVALAGHALQNPPREIDRRSEEHTSELQSLMRISYAVFCLNKKKKPTTTMN